DAAYWPLWVNITVPLLSALAFAAVQALLLFVDDPGLRSAKRAGLYPRLRGSPPPPPPPPPPANRPARAPSPEAAAEAGELSASGTDAAVQCDLLRPAASTSLFRPQQHHLYQVHPSQQQNTRQREPSVSAPYKLATSAMLAAAASVSAATPRRCACFEGMPAQAHKAAHGAFSSAPDATCPRSDSRIGAGAIIQRQLFSSGHSVSDWAERGQRLLHSVNHYYQQHQRLQARQMRYSTPVQPNWRPNADEPGVHVDMPVPPTAAVKRSGRRLIFNSRTFLWCCKN
uniref:PhoLip_ATPase_C domain-containing protein n=1 Tax=Macrostomum lignano TaxID=282301 RepID=A0A1I8IS02_9PLAT